MTPTVHLLTGERPGSGGVGDYTQTLSLALNARGVAARLWHIHEASFRSAFERAIRDEPGWVLLQYVPNALGYHGVNVPFCAWMLALRRRGVDVRVMFHEPYFYFSWRRPWLNVLALAQRGMAAMLLNASPLSYVSTARWIGYLRPLAPTSARFVPLPIPATVATCSSPSAVAAWRGRFTDGRTRPVVAHFGTYGRHVSDVLTPILLRLFETRPDARIVCVGRGSEAYATRLAQHHPAAAGRIIAAGELSATEASAALRACDVALQPYPDGVTTRRTSVMAPIANHVATVTSSGFLTEPVWTETGAVALAPAPDPAAHARLVEALLDDPGRAAALAGRGAAAYESRFSVAHTVDVLLNPQIESIA